MGGTAFGSPCRRLRRIEHEHMTLEACATLGGLGIKPRAVPSYRSKEDHGDIDILAVGAEGMDKSVAEAFGAEKALRNGECLSLMWRGAQLDIVNVSEDLLDAAFGYFSWADLGNFLGRIAKAGGFCYGHRGLGRWVTGPTGGRAAVIPVCTRTRDIFHFFGLDHSRWMKGFDEPEDIYAFAASSPLFSRRIFEPMSLDHRSRVRNRKRPVYAGLLDWSRGKNLPNFDFHSATAEWWDQRTVNVFGAKWVDERARWIQAEGRRAEVASKFNGERVRSLTGLVGPELGAFIQQFKRGIDARFDEWVLEQDNDSLDRAILEYFKPRAGLGGGGGGKDGRAK